MLSGFSYMYSLFDSPCAALFQINTETSNQEAFKSIPFKRQEDKESSWKSCKITGTVELQNVFNILILQ